MTQQAPPEYMLTGKGDDWYLERMAQDQWDPFDSEQETVDEAWADYVSRLAAVLRGTDRSPVATYLAVTKALFFLRAEVGLSQGTEGLIAEMQDTRWRKLSVAEEAEVEEQIERLKEPPKRVPVGVALLLVNHKGEYLLHERKGKHGGGTFSFPGGALDPGEQPAQAVYRELDEEAGINCDMPLIFEPKPYVHTSFEDGQDWVTLYYVAAHAGQVPRVMEPNKNAGWRWAKLADFPEPLFAPLEQVMPALKSFEGSELFEALKERAQESVPR